MSADIIPNSGRILMAEAVKSAFPFLFALSRGNPAWDGQWSGGNPPVPALTVTSVLDLIGYARPTIVDYLTPDDAGAIIMSGGGRYSVSATPTRYLRARLSLPVGSFAGQTVREIGLFGGPTIDASVPAGQTIVPNNKVSSPGRLFELHWRTAVVLEEGDFFARNFLVRI